MTFRVGDFVVRMEKYRLGVWEEECKNHNIRSDSVLRITEIRKDGMGLCFDKVDRMWTSDYFEMINIILDDEFLKTANKHAFSMVIRQILSMPDVT